MTETPVDQMSFEQAMKELETVVGQLERGDVALDESIALYERGAELKKRCEDKLNEAQEKVAKLEQIVKQKEKQREEREQLVKLNKQIAHFKMMEKQLTARRDKLKESIEEKRWIREDTS